MPSAYSFIDVAILDGVRERFAAGEAVVVLSIDLDRILWANGPGATLFGYPDIESTIGAASRLSQPALRQIRATAGFPEIGRDRSLSVRLARGMNSQAIAFRASAVELPDGEKAIVLAVPSTDPKFVRAIGGFSQEGHFAAFVDSNGEAVAASAGFSALGIESDTIKELVSEAGDERDRLAKRIIKAKKGNVPAGLARLTDDPALYFLVVVDDPQEEIAAAPLVMAEPIEAAPAEPAVPTLSEKPKHDGGDFSGEEPAQPETVSKVPAEKPKSDRPVRFTWRTDAEGRFSDISPEFADAVGEHAADVIGRRFRDVATILGLDLKEDVAILLEGRDTWSGRTIKWPVAGTNMRIPVDLAALPVYGRDRNFEGFRGFGVARVADAVVDPEAIGTALVPNGSAPQAEFDEPSVEEPEIADPFQGEVPALSIEPQAERRDADRVLRLAEHRPNVSEKGGLSPVERNAFREIGERLKREGSASKSWSRPAEEPQQDESEAAFENERKIVAETPAPETPKPDVEAAESPREIAEETQPGELEAPVSTNPSELAVLATLPVPILIHSGDTLHYANAEFLELSGYSSVEALSEAGGLGALFTDPYNDDVSADHSLGLRTRDGQEFPIEALLRSVPWNGGKALMLVVRRSGEAEEVEERSSLPSAEAMQLRLRLAEMRTILDTATDGVVLITPDGMIRSISRPAEALFGFDNDDVAGKPFVSMFAIESQRAVTDYIGGLSDHGVASVLNDGREVIGREAQGRFIPLFLSIGKLPDQRGYCAVVRDITHWKRAEEELTQSRAQAERASSQKTDFLARVSHEIRTPLNAIIGFSELMMDEKFGPIANDRYRDYLRDINRSGNHVLDLVNDLLDISKIEAGQQEMDYEAVSLNETLLEIVAMMQPQANRERVIIRSSFSSRLPDVVADLRSVRQIALNILSNAIRYTQAGGQVIISTSYELSGDIVMRVRDTGIGMTQPEIEQALKPFKQINSLKRARGDGTGLGLPLTKAMVEANRARFMIASTPGEGTLVEVTFPSTRVLAE
ncbi:PAS domain S-box protein [Mesorhizobium sp. SB112]|uniref:PAS domain S-box protein n=1 Tax=Mesorhizobium sp. SB112 TaxID=3151853 RepID=UPI003263BCAF